MTTRVLTLAALFLTLASGMVAVGQEPPRIEDIRAAWSDRQAKAQSLRVEWNQTNFVVKGGDSVGRISPDGKAMPLNPPDDHSFTSSQTMMIEGDKVTFSFLRRFWNADAKHYSDFPTELKFTGDRLLSLDRAGFTAWPQALIRKMQSAGFPPLSRPILRAFRGVAEKLRPDDLDDCVVTGAFIQIDGRRSYELLAKGSPARTEHRLWVDPTRGYVATRSTYGEANRSTLQTDVKYQSDSALGWVPLSWKLVEMSWTDGRIMRSSTATVTACVPSSVEPEAFAFTLPVGTRVVDETGEGPRNYITKEDGKRRVMGPSDAGKSYDEILSSPGPDESVLRWLWQPVTLVVFVAGGIVLLFTRVWLSRRRSRHVLPPDAQR